MSHFPKAKTINENKNGVHLKIDDLNFGHIHESNTTIMSSLKTQIHNFFIIYRMTTINFFVKFWKFYLLWCGEIFIIITKTKNL
jgi:hypothetical protein